MKERDPDGNMRISVEQVEDIYRIYKVTHSTTNHSKAK